MLAEYSNCCTMMAEYSNHCTMLAECSNHCTMLAEYSNRCTMMAEYSNHCTMMAEFSNHCTMLAKCSNRGGTRPPSVHPTSIMEVLGLIPSWNSFLHSLLVNHHLDHSFHAIPSFVYSHFFHSSIPWPTFHSNKIIPKK